MSYEDVDDEIWEKYFRTNVLAANGLTKFYLPDMIQNNFGRIIFIASEEAMMPSGQMPQYCMTKSMLLSLSKSLSKLTRGTEVTSNTIMPGPTLSEKVYQIIESMFPSDMAFSEKEKKFMAAHLPQSEIQRFIKPYEIGRLAAFDAARMHRHLKALQSVWTAAKINDPEDGERAADTVRSV